MAYRFLLEAGRFAQQRKVVMRVAQIGRFHERCAICVGGFGRSLKVFKNERQIE